MIDAINTSYSSIHVGRRQNNSTNEKQSFGRLYKTEAEFLAKSMRKPSAIKSLAVVTGCAGTMSMIISTIFSAGDLLKGDFCKFKEIFRHAGIMSVIGFSLYGGVKLLENALGLKE